MLTAGKTLAEVYQTIGITESTWLRWKKQFGGMKSDEAKRLRELEIENQRLKLLLAEAELDKKILKVAAEGKLLSPTGETIMNEVPIGLSDSNLNAMES